MEVVFHLAAVPSVARSVADPALSHRANATATLHTLIAARDTGVRRFVYAGSSSVYGNSPRLPKHESMTPSPLSPYAAGKLAGEQYVRIFSDLYRMETVTLRYFNVFGPRQSAGSPYSGVIGLFVTALLSGRTPVIYGDGRQSRDFTYVANILEANRLALRARGLRGQSVNVATGRRVSLAALLSALSRQTGRPARARHLAPRAGDVRHSLADISQARKLLGYRPIVDFEAGLRATVEWYGEAPGASRGGRRERPPSRRR
jgi:UDP-glucose 4-epimerase